MMTNFILYLLQRKWLRSPLSTPFDIVFSKGLMTSIKIPNLKVPGNQNFPPPQKLLLQRLNLRKLLSRFNHKKSKKGKRAAKEVIRVDVEDNQPSGKSEDNVLDRTFPYLEFMDKFLVTPIVLNQIGNDPDGVVDSFNGPITCF